MQPPVLPGTDVGDPSEQILEGQGGAAGTRGAPRVDRNPRTLRLLNSGALGDCLRHGRAEDSLQLLQAVAVLGQSDPGTVGDDGYDVQPDIALSPCHFDGFDRLLRALHREVRRLGDHDRLVGREERVAGEFPSEGGQSNRIRS